ncbi:MAG: hypothetical protein ACLR7U_01635 [Ruthenibacterium lactatiformans]
MLREKIESVAAAGRIKVMQQFRGLLYNIEAMQLPSDGEAYTAFYFLASTPPCCRGQIRHQLLELQPIGGGVLRRYL